jgi:hypothetical protein
MDTKNTAIVEVDAPRDQECKPPETFYMDYPTNNNDRGRGRRWILKGNKVTLSVDFCGCSNNLYLL